jgi:hypothetical protein
MIGDFQIQVPSDSFSVLNFAQIIMAQEIQKIIANFFLDKFLKSVIMLMSWTKSGDINRFRPIKSVVATLSTYRIQGKTLGR